MVSLSQQSGGLGRENLETVYSLALLHEVGALKSKLAL